jgi:hypothetical protein
MQTSNAENCLHHCLHQRSSDRLILSSLPSPSIDVKMNKLGGSSSGGMRAV